MTCREFIEFVWKYLDGELSGEQRRVFDEHLAICPACVDYLETYRRTVRFSCDAFADPGADVPADVPEDLILAILASRSR